MILLAVLAAGGTGVTARAQAPRPAARPAAPAPRPMAAERTKHLNELLALSEEQSRRVLAILMQQDTRAAEDHAAAGGSRRAEEKALRARVAASDRAIEALLTPEQVRKYSSYKKSRRNELDRRKRPRGEEYQ